MGIENINELIEKFTNLKHVPSFSLLITPQELEFTFAKTYVLNQLINYRKNVEDRAQIEQNIKRFQRIRAACVYAMKGEKPAIELTIFPADKPEDTPADMHREEQAIGKMASQAIRQKSAQKGNMPNVYTLAEDPTTSFEAIWVYSTETLSRIQLAALKGRTQTVLSCMDIVSESAAECDEDTGYNALTLAIRSGRLDNAQAMIEKDQTLLNTADNHGFTPLLIATCFPSDNTAPFIQFLLNQQGIDLKKTYKDKHACDWAKTLNNDALVKLLGPKYATLQLLAPRPFYRNTWETKIAEHKIEEMALAFVNQYGDWVNARFKGIPLIHFAATEGWVKTVAALVSHGENINRPWGKDNLTPLHVATIHRAVPVVEYLLTQPNIAVDNTWFSRNANTNHIHEDMVLIFLQHDKLNYNTFSIHAAAQYNDTRILHTLTHEYPNAHKNKNMEGNTPLHMAAQCGRGANADLLIKAGAHVDETNNLGETPLHLACKRGNTGVVKILLEGEANINKFDKKKNTPLQLAIERNDTDGNAIVRFLINLGADIMLIGNNGQIPIQTALANRNNTAAQALRIKFQSQHSLSSRNDGAGNDNSLLYTAAILSMYNQPDDHSHNHGNDHHSSVSPSYGGSDGDGGDGGGGY